MKQVTVVNHFNLKEGKLDEFIETQEAFAREIGGTCGLVGGRMYRGLDGKSAVLISTFESLEAQALLRERPEFQAHVKRLQAFLVDAKPALYEVAYTTGRFE